MPVVVNEITFDPPPEHEAHGVWSPTVAPGWGQKEERRLSGPMPEMPANMWAAELEGYTPTEEDQAWWADQLAPESALGPTIDQAEYLTRCPSDDVDGWEACMRFPFLDRF
jgi:hypothetical protein